MGLPEDFAPRKLGRYVLCDPIARGGMAAVHLGRLLGPVGFARTVAIKRLHEKFAKDPGFVTAFLDEARMAARIRHPNVVSILDVVAEGGELFLVMDYVQGDSLQRLLQVAREKQMRLPIPMAIGVIADVLYGLHAAHEAKSETGEPMGLVHRDLSPHNVIVGTDGVARVVDFGVAKAKGRLQQTVDGSVKGKISYMAPEQLTHAATDRRVDLFATSIVLWEALTGERLFAGDSPGAIAARILSETPPAPSALDPRIPRELDWVVTKGLSRNPGDRPATARAMATMLEQIGARASAGQIGDWVEAVLGPELAERAARVARLESSDLLARMASAPELPPATRSRDTSRLSLADGTEQSVVSDAFVAPRRSNATTLAVLGGVLGLGLTVGVGVLVTRSGKENPSVGIVAPAASAPVVPPSAATPEPPVAPVPAASDPPPVASVAPPVATAPGKAPPAKGGKGRGNCNPPWVLTETGSKRYKPECL